MSHFQPTVVASTSYPAKMFPIILQPNDYLNTSYIDCDFLTFKT